MSYENYEEWEVQQDISPSSPEAYYAEKAWNAALNRACYLIQMSPDADGYCRQEAPIVIANVLDEIRGLITE